MKVACVCVVIALVYSRAWSADEGAAIKDVSPPEQNNKELLEIKKSYDTIQTNYSSLKEEYVHMMDEHAQLKKDYLKLSETNQMVTADRDNLLIQTKKLTEAKNRTEEMLAMLDRIKQEVDKSKREREEALSQNQMLKARITGLEDTRKDFETTQKQLIREKEQLADNVAKLEEKIKSNVSDKEIASLKQENTAIANRLKQVQAEAGQLKKSEEAAAEYRAKTQDTIVQYRAKAEESNRKYKEIVKRTRAFEHKLVESPSRMYEIARQNKVLIEQTATMHYNLGVFYTRQKEYSRAAVEFEKTLELKPDDAQAHFNLGYIYAEYVVNRNKAVNHFQEYLKYVKANDKDVDWVKKYILTWQSWEGKEPMK